MKDRVLHPLKVDSHHTAHFNVSVYQATAFQSTVRICVDSIGTYNLIFHDGQQTQTLRISTQCLNALAKACDLYLTDNYSKE